MPEGRSIAPGTGTVPAFPPETAGSVALAAVLGTWDVRRVIVDHLSGAVHRFSGQAVIGPAEFFETGEARYAAMSLKAERRYGLRRAADGVAVAFADGRPFIRLDGQAAQTVRHLCGDDDYRGRFLFRDADAWVEMWRVAGPRKHYSSLARYRRLAG